MPFSRADRVPAAGQPEEPALLSVISSLLCSVSRSERQGPRWVSNERQRGVDGKLFKIFRFNRSTSGISFLNSVLKSLYLASSLDFLSLDVSKSRMRRRLRLDVSTLSGRPTPPWSSVARIFDEDKGEIIRSCRLLRRIEFAPICLVRALPSVPSSTCWEEDDEE